MLISLNTVKNYAKVPQTVSDHDLIELIGSRLVEVEEAIDLAPKYRGIYVVKVVSCEAIPETHLSLCQIDAGEHNAEFNQLDNGLVQVVCGAPNAHAGMLAVWITPGAIVPETYGNENFKLSVRKLRGYESYGMLAGADELGLATEHKAIAEIDPKMARPGDNFAEVFGLNDIILDVENKSLTHRPDCFGLIGFAREVAGILGLKFEEPEVFRGHEALKLCDDLALTVEIADAELCPRYSCAVFDLPDNQPSKYLTPDAVFLAKAGMRAIDPMVDLTNILMLETGQPLHAFDYDKLVAVGGSKTPTIIVRAAQADEELQLLDGKTISCVPDDILITSNDVPVALAGAMGGKNTEVDASTQRVVLESATFSLYHLRKTQMAHGIFSEAITRFTKGQPAAMTGAVLAEAIQRLEVQPLAVVDEWPAGKEQIVVKITTEKINGLLGTNYSVEEVVRTLENVGFEVATVQSPLVGIRSHGEEERVSPATAGADDAPRNDDCAVATLKITVPLWRTDIHLPEDIIEEVGRLLGYDNIPLQLPTKAFVEPKIAPMITLKSELRTLLSERLAMNEVITYSFVSRNLLEKVGEKVTDSYEIVNSISPELQCFRQQIVPSLLDKVRENLKAGHKKFSLYEINQVTRKSSGLTDEGTPVMRTHLGIVCLGDFYELKAQVLALFRQLNLPVEYKALDVATAEHDPYLEPKRSAELYVEGQKIGAFGEIKAGMLRNFKLETIVTALEINLEKIVGAKRSLTPELKLSKFPFVERDLTLKVASESPFGRVLNVLEEVLQGQDLVYTVTPVSIYQASPEDSTKNLSFHLKFSNPRQTLRAAEISVIMESITKAAAQIGAQAV